LEARENRQKFVISKSAEADADAGGGRVVGFIDYPFEEGFEGRAHVAEVFSFCVRCPPFIADFWSVLVMSVGGRMKQLPTPGGSFHMLDEKSRK
jgi:hypothetical protein